MQYYEIKLLYTNKLHFIYEIESSFMTNAIEILELSKEFIPSKSFYQLLFCQPQGHKAIFALNNITINIKQNGIFALVGPNGAGKTTLIKILSCLILPTKGKARVCGYDILKEEEKVKSSIGLIGGDERSFYGRLTLRENLMFFASLYNISARQAKKRIEELISFVEINSHLDRRFQECSTGIKQRLVIVRSLLNDPPILFMDEPTKSLDPIERRNLKNFIKEKLVKKQGKTVLFTTHDLSEIENFADKVAIMNHGEIKACGSFMELRDKINLPQATIEDIYEQIVKR